MSTAKKGEVKQCNDLSTVTARAMCCTLAQGTAVGAGLFSSTATLTSSFCRVALKVSTTNKHKKEKLSICF